MDVSEFRGHLVNEYSDFTRSFTRIRADDIRTFFDSEYDSQKFWPEPLIQVNPNFKEGGTVEGFVYAGHLHPLCADIFRFGKTPLFEAKMIHQFDHRWATYVNAQNKPNGLDTADLSDAPRADPNCTVRPRYWVDEVQVLARIARVPSRVASAWLAWHEAGQSIAAAGGSR